MLTIASIETLKRQKNKCGKDEVFKLVKDMIEENITREIFNKTLDCLIQSGSVKCSLISSLSLRKYNAIENSNLQGNFNNFKEDLIKDFDKLKKHFLLRLNHLKINYYNHLKILMTHPMMVLRYLQLTYKKCTFYGNN